MAFGIPDTPKLEKPTVKGSLEGLGKTAIKKNPITISVAITIAVVVGVSLLILIPILVLAGGVSDPQYAVDAGIDQLIGNTPQEGAPPSSPGQTPTCPDQGWAKCLKDQFNVTVFSDYGAPTPSQEEFIYKTLAIPLSYSNYLRLFKSTNLKINISRSNCPYVGGACHAVTNQGQIILYPPFFGDRPSTQQEYLIHETGHLIAYTREGSKLQDELNASINGHGLDANCFKPGPLIKTYPLDTAINTQHEVFAESVADTLVCNDKGSCGGWGGGTINNFPSTCSNTYNFVAKEVLGAQSTGSSSTGQTSGGPAVYTNNSCGGKYTSTMKAIQKDYPQITTPNFGDPQCTFNENDFENLIKTKDPTNANFWISISKCESGSPNGYTRVSKGKGAWGKFQMGQSAGSPLKTTAQNTAGRGDVPWQQQVTNAIAFNKAHDNNFIYWGTARCLCNFAKYKNTSQCSYIVKHNLQRASCNNACVTAEGTH